MPRQMHFMAYLKTGPTATHAGGWRHPESTLGDIFEPTRYEHIARVLEDACFDGCFFADLFGLYDIHRGGFDTYVERGGQISFLDPMVVLPIMARATTRLGLGATLSTTLFNAYHLARSLLSLDVLSKGRVAWNIVTSATELEAQNFGLANLPPKEARYDHADEVLEACMALWRSWEPDAFVLDKAAGRLADPAKVHYADYAGTSVRTRGPLSIPPSAQGHPVLMQAGASERGRDFAARWAEVVFAAQSGKDAMRAFYRDLKDRMDRRGRRPEDCAVLVQTTCIVGETDAIARDKADYVNSLAEEELMLANTSSNVGVDMSRYREGEALASLQGAQGIQGAVDLLEQVRAQQNLTLGEAARRLLPNQIIGSPVTVADRLEELFRAEACDGFVLTPATFPTSHEAFARAVVPELQRRGLFRTAYRGRTLREHLRE
ncbi:NtaA/DmoA family FMN-dependent monooxygenase [Labrys wisconsinensis]|uniref:FMN-dependent oxidoreductase (Nitrilotriacetate monooxygenase family) n=1 Tax=Labrys wisconsinensis TaxID=425677 RepID=A0ABU0J6G5_9HYPH|nr:NtaA/DmoA family FMN-dependent monooxygenase [Labrys wisconsinensis]MDQ0469851.1 FMN-dependent oxidoreductase (nitrilotriacetate monooxygenase family) [Labrys wisconsinensis]